MKKIKEYLMTKCQSIGAAVAVETSGAVEALNKKRAGAFAFEYVIILVLMAAIIFLAFDTLGDAVQKKVAAVANSISNEGHGR